MQAWGMSPWEGRKEPSRLTGTTAFLPAHPLSGQPGTARLCLPPQPHGSSSAGILLSAGLESWEQLLGWEIPLYPELLFNKDFRQLQCNKPSLLPGGGGGGGLLGCRQTPPPPCRFPTSCLQRVLSQPAGSSQEETPSPGSCARAPGGCPVPGPPPSAAGADSFKELFIDTETSVFFPVDKTFLCGPLKK